MGSTCWWNEWDEYVACSHVDVDVGLMLIDEMLMLDEGIWVIGKCMLGVDIHLLLNGGLIIMDGNYNTNIRQCNNTTHLIPFTFAHWRIHTSISAHAHMYLHMHNAQMHTFLMLHPARMNIVTCLVRSVESPAPTSGSTTSKSRPSQLIITRTQDEVIMKFIISNIHTKCQHHGRYNTAICNCNCNSHPSHPYKHSSNKHTFLIFIHHSIISV